MKTFSWWDWHQARHACGEVGADPSLPVSPIHLEVFTDEKTHQRQMPPTTPLPVPSYKNKSKHFIANHTLCLMPQLWGILASATQHLP